LHVIPYFVSEADRHTFVDTEGRLSEDQRHQWWQNYAAAKGKAYDGLLEPLKIKQVIPITREPLLNYLVALSYERQHIAFS
jgi:hypothetical protein